MGVDQHFHTLVEITADEECPAVTQPEVGNAEPGQHPGQLDGFRTSVELVGIPHRKVLGDEDWGFYDTVLFLPVPDKGRHCTILTFVALTF